jgi:hypothetical protein
MTEKGMMPAILSMLHDDELMLSNSHSSSEGGAAGRPPGYPPYRIACKNFGAMCGRLESPGIE